MLIGNSVGIINPDTNGKDRLKLVGGGLETAAEKWLPKYGKIAKSLGLWGLF